MVKTQKYRATATRNVTQQNGLKYAHSVARFVSILPDGDGDGDSL